MCWSSIGPHNKGKIREKSSIQKLSDPSFGHGSASQAWWRQAMRRCLVPVHASDQPCTMSVGSQVLTRTVEITTACSGAADRPYLGKALRRRLPLACCSSEAQRAGMEPSEALPAAATTGGSLQDWSHRQTPQLAACQDKPRKGCQHRVTLFLELKLFRKRSSLCEQLAVRKASSALLWCRGQKTIVSVADAP